MSSAHPVVPFCRFWSLSHVTHNEITQPLRPFLLVELDFCVSWRYLGSQLYLEFNTRIDVLNGGRISGVDPFFDGNTINIQGMGSTVSNGFWFSTTILT